MSLDPTLDWVLRGCFAWMWLQAGWSKLRAPGTFAAVVANYRLLPRAAAGPTARALAGCELLLGAALLPAAWRQPALAACAALLVLYAAAVAINLARGRRDIDCGCAGPGRQRPLSGGLVARNLLLALLALATASGARVERPWTAGDLFTAIAACVFVAVCARAGARLQTQAAWLAGARRAS